VEKGIFTCHAEIPSGHESAHHHLASQNQQKNLEFTGFLRRIKKNNKKTHAPASRSCEKPLSLANSILKCGQPSAFPIKLHPLHPL
jgi:hypothetical protein